MGHIRERWGGGGGVNRGSHQREMGGGGVNHWSHRRERESINKKTKKINQGFCEKRSIYSTGETQ